MTAPVHLWNLLGRVDRPDALVLAHGDHRVDGPALAAMVRRRAGGLVAEGFGPGDRLLVHVPKSVDQVAWMWAAAVAGGLGVIAPPRLKDDQVRHLLADAEPFAVVTDPARDLLLAQPAEVWAGQRMWTDDSAVGAAPLARPVDEDPDAPCILLYSSGSTGPPKAIQQSHRTLVDGARIVSAYLELTPRDHVLAALALSFDYGLNQVLAAAWTGCAVSLWDYLGGADLAEAVTATQATVLAGVPTLWRDLAAHGDASALQSLRCLTNSGGAWMPGDIEWLQRSLPEAALHSMYGLTEAFRSASLTPGELEEHPTSVGRAVPEVELLLVDPDGGLIEGAGTGELVHVGAFVGAGYWRRPEATAARFRPAPDGRPAVWSGDLMRRDAAGRLFFEARLDGQLKVDGHRVSPDEVVDAVLIHCDGVREAAVVGVADGARGHRLVLFWVPDAEPASDQDPSAEVRRRCRRVLPPHLVPAEVRAVRALPRTAHGKVDLVRLRQQVG